MSGKDASPKLGGTLFLRHTRLILVFPDGRLTTLTCSSLAMPVRTKAFKTRMNNPNLRSVHTNISENISPSVLVIYPCGSIIFAKCDNY